MNPEVPTGPPGAVVYLGTQNILCGSRVGGREKRRFLRVPGAQQRQCLRAAMAAATGVLLVVHKRGNSVLFLYWKGY